MVELDYSVCPMAFRFWFLPAILVLCSSLSSAGSFQYMRVGRKADVATKTSFGIAMMGGGSDLDEAFRWLCNKGNGGDFLILRARGDDDYNPYVNGLCQANSVATLIIPDREAAQDPRVAEIIREAEAVFIAGGDQSRYVNFWKGTPVQEAMNQNIAEGKPIGGTSAGLAIQGEFSYGCLKDKPDDPDLASKDVLVDPFHERVTLVRDFLKIPHLEAKITDSHFAKRDRLGRTLVFLSRLVQDGWAKDPRDIAIDEKSAFLVEADGKGVVMGPGKGIYFIHPTQAPKVCREKTPLTFQKLEVYHGPAGSHFDLNSWTGQGGKAYSLSVDGGIVSSTQTGNALY
jgi:cyanophycinase